MDNLSRGERLRKLLDDVLLDSMFPWWEWDILKNVVTSNDLKVTMLGYDPADFQGKGYEAYTDLLHPDDYERTMEAMRGYLSGRKNLYQVDYRIEKAGGGYTWYMDRGAVIEHGKDGNPVRLRGIVIDLGKDLQDRARDEAFVKLLRRAIPGPDGVTDVATLCSACKRLKVDEDTWIRVNESFQSAFPASISHGLCRDCIQKLYPDLADK